jgi:uncharacterized membrane protein
MHSPRHLLIELVERGAIPPMKIGEALRVAGVSPDGRAWRIFLDRLLLWLGGLALAFAALFFVAYNWNEIGRFAKFAMVEAAIVLVVLAYWKFGAATVKAKVSLLVATILLGVLLALYGQTYQTGADPWQLFFTWSLMMLPWAIIGRFAAIWIVWIALVNLSVVLYYETFGGMLWLMIGADTGMYWLLFLFNSAALAVWEWRSGRWRWLAERWAIRLVAVASGVPITMVMLHAIFDQNGGALAALAWMAALAGVYGVYRRVKPDLFMLAGGCLSAIVVLVSFLSRHMLDQGGPGAYLFISLVVIGLGAGSAVWLKQVHRELHP